MAVSSAELIKEFNRSTRRLRAGLIALLIVIIIALGWLLGVTLSTENALRQQIDQNHQQAVDAAKSQKDLLEAVQKQHDNQDAELRCIAQLFTSNSPRNLTITDFNTCSTTAANVNENTRSGYIAPSNVNKTPTPQPAPTLSSKPTPPPAAPGRTFVQQVLHALGLGA